MKCKRGDAFSWHVLIGRGLDPNLAKGTPIKATQLLFSFEGACLQKRYVKSRNALSIPAGADYAEVPPVPIPNTEVKLRSAEDTWLETTWENR